MNLELVAGGLGGENVRIMEAIERQRMMEEKRKQEELAQKALMDLLGYNENMILYKY